MSNFIYNSYCVEHPGQVRFLSETQAEQGGALERSVTNARVSASASLMLGVAAVVAALLVIAAHVDAERQDAWMALVVVGAAALALFSEPVRRACSLVRSGYRAWVESRQQEAADERLWNAALQDARLMADLARAMDRQSRN